MRERLPLDNSERLPYDRQPGEPERAYAAFKIFLEREPRDTITGLSRRLSKSRQLLDRWCQQWRWRERAVYYDADQRRQRDDAVAADRAALIQQHAQAARVLLNVALRAMAPRPLLDKGGRAVTDAAGRPAYVPATPRDLAGAATALDKAIHHQRLAAGLPTAHTQQDLALKQNVAEALATQQAIRTVIEEQLCDDCRDRVGNELRRVAARHRQLQADLG
ncbi:MAG TPA: hypothetical protein VIL85_12000 [Thermomicrobiales bacterium]|jgi:hypothetical protein